MSPTNPEDPDDHSGSPDLRLELRPGGFLVDLMMTSFALDLEPDEIDALAIMVELDVEPALLEAVDQRAANGEPSAQIPIYFARTEDEFGIGMFSDPGIDEAILTPYADHLFEFEGGEEELAELEPWPVEWRSLLTDWTATGIVDWYVHFSRDDMDAANSGSCVMASGAHFVFTRTDLLLKRRYFTPNFEIYGSGANAYTGVFSFLKEPGFLGIGWNYKKVLHKIRAYKGDHPSRAVVLFKGVDTLRKIFNLQDPKNIKEMSVGTRTTTIYGDQGWGVKNVEWEPVVVYRATHLVKRKGSTATMTLDWPNMLNVPYSQTSTSLPGGATMSVGTWSTPSADWKSIDGKMYVMGELSSGPGGSAATSAAGDLVSWLQKGATNFPVILAMPYDEIACVPCTANHNKPEVQALNGDYRVGAGFNDLRLEVVVDASTRHSSNVLHFPVGNHQGEIRPGETQFDTGQHDEIVAVYEPRNLRAAAGILIDLKSVSGPVRLRKNSHYYVTSPLATPTSNGGAVVIHPDRLRPGAYSVDVVPCLQPSGWAAPKLCLPTQRLDFTVTQAAPTPPVVEYLTPWSADSPSSSFTFSVSGLNLDASGSATRVNVPNVVNNATPQSGSSDTRLNVQGSVGAGLCGPRTVTATSSSGADTSIFNITRPFRGSSVARSVTVLTSEDDNVIECGRIPLPYSNYRRGGVYPRPSDSDVYFAPQKIIGEVRGRARMYGRVNPSRTFLVSTA